MPRKGNKKSRAPQRSGPRPPRANSYPHEKVLEPGQEEHTVLLRRPGYRAGATEGALRPTIPPAPAHIIARSHHIRVHLIADRAVKLVWGNKEGSALNIGVVPTDWPGASIQVVNPESKSFTLVVDATTQH